jgi:hypothetical protein
MTPPRNTACFGSSIESSEDYLYPKKSFRPIALPQAVKRAVLAA